MVRTRIANIFGVCVIFFVFFVFDSMTPALALTTSALIDQTCAGYRDGGKLTCTAGEFTVNPVFSAAPGTPPFCVANQAFQFLVELGLSGTNADRHDIGFFVGQQQNDPRDTTAGNNCSVATFPLSPAPWSNLDSDSCGDFLAAGNQVTIVDKIKVVCVGDSTSALLVPYVVTYWQNTGIVCSGPANVKNGAPSKCNAGTTTVSGTVSVYSGAYIDVTKQTVPSGDTQSFTFNASGPAGPPMSRVIALTGCSSAQLANAQPGDLQPGGNITPCGDYIPSLASQATNLCPPSGYSGTPSTITLTHGNTARFYINAISTAQILTITEALADANWWESTVTGSCTGASLTGSSRQITASLSTSSSSATCSITNYKRARITLNKNISGGRIDPSDQFTISATQSGGSALTGTTSATSSGNTNPVATMTFYSSGASALYATPSVTLQEIMAPGSNSALTQYTSSLTCTGTFTGSGTLPNGLVTTSASITPGPGDDITCTFTNSPKPVAPTIAKSFTPSNVALNGTSTMRFVVTNPNTGSGLSGIAFSDTLPAGITAPNGTTSVCGGSLQITGTNQLDFTGGTLAASGTCNIDVTVTGAAAGAQNNTTGVISSTESGSGTTSNTATLNVYAPPTVTKTFTPPSIASGGTSSMQIIVTNPGSNPGNLTGVSISDSYGGTLTNNAAGSVVCSGAGSATLTGGLNGGTTVGFTNGTIVPGGTCTITQSVTATSTSNNTTGQPGATGPVALTGTAAGPVTLTAAVAVLTIVKSAVPSPNVTPGQVITYSMLVTNTTAGTATSVTLNDTLSPYIDWGVDSYGNGVAFQFVDSVSNPSGLTMGTATYNNGTYTPTPGSGYDSNVNNFQLPMTGTMNGNGVFTINYMVRVK